MNGLKLSDSLTLPIDAVTQTFAAIGRRGAGKTYLAGVLAEQMLDIGAQTVILDPVGNWWGLRLLADGKKKGKDISILGGSHADLPMSSASGARIAKLLVEKPISALIDTSDFREGERKRFAADFAEEFFHLKKTQTSAVHLFIEEAQLFAPQFPRPSRGEKFSEAEMLGAFERIIRLGRNYGIGATLITQRPQSVNKEVLNQTECLCVLQVNGRQEREALQRWVEEHGADRGLVGELPGLHQGEGFVWSPSWLRIFQKMHFAKKTTFDSSATPKVGAKMKATVLSKMDVASLKADLEDVITRAEKDDPKTLKARIAELEKELKKKPAAAPANPPRITRELLEKEYASEIMEIIEKKVVPEILPQIIPHQVQSFFGPSLKTTIETLMHMRAMINANLDILQHDAKILDDPAKWDFKFSFSPRRPAAIVPKLEPVAEWPKPAPPREVPPSNNGKVTGPEQRILDAIAWFEAIGVEDPQQAAVAFLAGYSYKSSSYNVPRSILMRKGLLLYLPGGKIQLTGKGLGLARAAAVPANNEGLQQMVLSKLPGPETRLLAALLRQWPHPLSNDELATEAGYSAGSSSYTVPRSRLKSFGLIEYPASGQVRARDLLFPLKR